MLKNYFKIAFRNFIRHKVSSFITVFGLATGMACTLILLIYVQYEWSYDGFQKNKDNLYRVNKVAYENGELTYKSAYTFSAQGQVMKNEIPEVEDFVRLYSSEGVLQYFKPDNSVISLREKNIYYADNSFFNLFSYRLLKGDKKSALSKPNSIVISETTANKFFGSENPIGKILKYHGKDLIITGISEDVPRNTHLPFTELLSFSTLKTADRNNWSNHAFYTYILLKDNADPKVVEPKLSKAFDKYMYKYLDRNYVTNIWNLQRVDHIYLYSTDFTSISMEYGNYKTVLYLFITALLVLIIGWINFVNHSASSMPERAKEIGIRKTVGASQKQIVKQFVTESIIINFVAVGISLAIAESLINWLSGFLGINISLFQSSDIWFWGAWTLLLSTGILFTSIFPSLWLSSIPATSAINKKLHKSAGSNYLQKILITSQFAISIALIIITFIMHEQISFTQNKDLGMSIDTVMVIHAPYFSNQQTADRNFQLFETTLTSYPGIYRASTSMSIPGNRFGNGNFGKIYMDGSTVQNNYFRIGKVDSNFISVYNLKLLAGHNFYNAFDNRNTVIINKEAMKVLKFQNAEDAIDKFIKWNGRLIKVIGVVDDFHQESFHKIIEPIVLYEQGFDQYVDYISIKFNRYNPDKHLPIIKKTFNAAFPGQSFDYFFLNDFFNKQYKTDINTGKLISGFASLAILIAVLGLFNLISFSVAKRTKEIGIRKVIGASTISILFLLTKDFIRLILIANLIAFPVAYYFMNKWLQDFAYRINMNWWVFILAGCVALAIALITVSFQAIKAAMANPVRSLRYE
jgi:putative ABC transport system permease protein